MLLKEHCEEASGEGDGGDAKPQAAEQTRGENAGQKLGKCRANVGEMWGG